MQSVRDWAEETFGSVELGDPRRSARLVKAAAGLAARPGLSIPQALGGWADVKAAYRLLGGEEVTHEAVLAPHLEHTRAALRESGSEWLVIEDWTQLDYTGREAKGLGQIGNAAGRGMLAHTSMALKIQEWIEDAPRARPIGLLGQKVWTRDPEAAKARKSEGWRERLKRERESQHWGEAIRQAGEKPPGVRWTLVADRECDLTDIWSGARLGENVDFVVRIFRKRLLKDGRLLEEALAQCTVLGRIQLKLRARPGKAARTAEIELRSTRVELRDSPRAIQLVHAREVNPPSAKGDAIDWRIATTWPADTFEQCRRVVRAYATRWLIEEYHKAWKTGAGIERAQLRDTSRLEPLAAILALVALRLLAAKFTTDEPLEVSSEDERAVIAILEDKYGKPKDGWSERELIRAIARFGGFLARKSDGEPGWQTIWRGWYNLAERLQGYRLAKRCG